MDSKLFAKMFTKAFTEGFRFGLDVSQNPQYVNLSLPELHKEAENRAKVVITAVLGENKIS